MDMLKEPARRTENQHALTETGDVRAKDNRGVARYKEVRCNEDRSEELQTTYLASAQELVARSINPMKLVMLLRVNFGIGHYEISVRLPLENPTKTRANCQQRMQNKYNIRTPRHLSVEEIARCRWD
jgi:hypothetical protein